MKFFEVVAVSLLIGPGVFASTHVCGFRKDEQRPQPDKPVPVLTNFSSDPLTISSTVFQSGQVSLRDSTGAEVEKMHFETGTKEYSPKEGPVRYIHLRFQVNGEQRDLGLSVSPTAPLARSMTSFDYEENKSIVLVATQLQCKLIP